MRNKERPEESRPPRRRPRETRPRPLQWVLPKSQLRKNEMPNLFNKSGFLKVNEGRMESQFLNTSLGELKIDAEVCSINFPAYPFHETFKDNAKSRLN